MSSGRECAFIEPEAGKWFYVLQDWTCPVGAWDWREHATCYGPFPSFGEAHRHLYENHSNPGGYEVTGHATYQADDTYRRLCSNARKDS